MVITLAVAILATVASPPPLQVSGDPEALIEWTRVISSPGNDWINDLVLLRNGDVGAAGFTGRRDDPPSDWSAVVAEIDPDGGTGRSSLPDTAGR
jgi:hypothetical protein